MSRSPPGMGTPLKRKPAWLEPLAVPTNMVAAVADSVLVTSLTSSAPAATARTTVAGPVGASSSVMEPAPTPSATSVLGGRQRDLKRLGGFGESVGDQGDRQGLRGNARREGQCAGGGDEVVPADAVPAAVA